MGTQTRKKGETLNHSLSTQCNERIWRHSKKESSTTVSLKDKETKLEKHMGEAIDHLKEIQELEIVIEAP